LQDICPIQLCQHYWLNYSKKRQYSAFRFSPPS